MPKRPPAYTYASRPPPACKDGNGLSYLFSAPRSAYYVACERRNSKATGKHRSDGVLLRMPYRHRAPWAIRAGDQGPITGLSWSRGVARCFSDSSFGWKGLISKPMSAVSSTRARHATSRRGSHPRLPEEAPIGRAPGRGDVGACPCWTPHLATHFKLRQFAAQQPFLAISREPSP